MPPYCAWMPSLPLFEIATRLSETVAPPLFTRTPLLPLPVISTQMP